jgi:hypothetical protein
MDITITSTRRKGIFMSETMKLLNKALEKKSGADWTRELGLSYNALTSSKTRGHLSPAIAGAMAESMGFDAIKWITVAALESERDSTCAARMRRKFGKVTSLLLRCR